MAFEKREKWGFYSPLNFPTHFNAQWKRKEPAEERGGGEKREWSPPLLFLFVKREKEATGKEIRETATRKPYSKHSGWGRGEGKDFQTKKKENSHACRSLMLWAEREKGKIGGPRRKEQRHFPSLLHR